jgi:glycosyltransferase involved in cell wall biosynthesis
VTPEPIIALSKDWDDDATCNHHVLLELSRTRRVLWLNSLAQRTPDLASGRDLGRVGRKLREFPRGPVNVANDLWVFTPLVLPLPGSATARRLNRSIVGATVRALRARLRIESFQLWTFLPRTAAYVGVLGESLSIYYCTDEHSLFSSLDARATTAAELELLRRVDVVFATNEPLVELKGVVHADVHLALHGVDRDLFATALDPATAVPEDVAGLPRPVLGFYGALHDWVDYELIAELARRRPDWSIALIGERQTDLGALDGLANVHVLGRRPNRELPACCKGFDVGLIPYRQSEQLRYRNPMKLREYLAAGLPVVGTLIPELRRYEAFGCSMADGVDDFERAVERALEGDSPDLRRRRSEAMAAEGWAARAAALESTLERTNGRRTDARAGSAAG